MIQMKQHNYTRRRNKKGGIPIFAGAQGCVFKPSLKCKHRPRNYHDGNISKLGEKESAEAEMREYEKIRRYLLHVKNHNKYFGMRAQLCEPDTLDRHDLENFDKVCINMERHNITESNVNANLNKLRMINMPDLGIDLAKWLDESKLDPSRIRSLNNHVSTLLVNAVGPMNRLGVIHNDLKSENVMIDATGDARIIDWGLAGISTARDVIPLHHFMNNPVTFNRPFSTMIISPNTRELYESTLTAAPSLNQLKQFTHDLYKKYIESYDIIGFEYLQFIFASMFGLSKKDATNVLMDFVSNYNADILQHFTNTTTRKFDLDRYFSTVYRYNTDVWGMMSIFYSIFTLPRSRFDMSNEAHSEMLRQYRTLFRTMIFVNGHKRMNVAHILAKLRQINNGLESSRGRVYKTVRFNVENRRGRHSIKRTLTPYPRNQENLRIF